MAVKLMMHLISLFIEMQKKKEAHEDAFKLDAKLKN